MLSDSVRAKKAAVHFALCVLAIKESLLRVALMKAIGGFHYLKSLGRTAFNAVQCYSMWCCFGELGGLLLVTTLTDSSTALSKPLKGPNLKPSKESRRERHSRIKSLKRLVGSAAYSSRSGKSNPSKRFFLTTSQYSLAKTKASIYINFWPAMRVLLISQNLPASLHV